MMRERFVVVVSVCFLCAMRTGVSADSSAAIANRSTRLETIRRGTAAVGVRLVASGQPLAEVFFGPNGLWRAKRVETQRRGGHATLRFVGFDTAGTGGTPKLSGDSFVEFALEGERPFPKVKFSFGLEAFDAKAWRAALPPDAPMYYLVCRVPGATMFYRGGGLMPAPEFEPFPLTRQGFMSGNWSPRWSYAAAMAAFAVPALGLWNPDAKVFVGYDFGEARHTDRSSKYLGSAYCAGEGRHQGDIFGLVHPYQAKWVDLTYPNGPARLASHFEWVYSRKLGSDRDPNEFVLTRFVRDHRDLLRPAPAMNDLTWIRDPGPVRLPHVITRSGGWGLMHRSGPSGLEGIFVELNALMLGSTYPGDGVRRMYQENNRKAIAKLHEQIEFLKPRAIWKDIDGDRCCTWKDPIEGKFKDRWGGDDCATIYHKSTWQIGTAMMIVYEKEGDQSLLPFIDGVYNWTKHALYTRDGVCDIPWAMFCHIGLAAGENFMLTYRRVFLGDAMRRRNMEEALRLARMVAYKSTWFYLADPDETDGVDPIFLGQAVVDRRWIGRVTWNECGWIPRTAIPLYCETGDPFLKYLVRGVAANFFVGFREDGGITENVQIFGETGAKGRRTAGTSGISNGAQMRRWAEPAGASPIRVCVGEKAAIAFCKDTFDYDVADYAYKPELNFRFRLVARARASREPIDLTLSAPFRDLRTRPIRINGKPLAKGRVEYNDFTDGEDVYIRGVRTGDVIEVGDAAGAAPAPVDPLPYRTLADAASRTVGRFRTVGLAGACNERLEMRYRETDSWYGWIYGLRWRDRVPYYFLSPALAGGRVCVKGDAKAPPRIAFDRADHLFAVFGVHKVAAAARLRDEATRTSNPADAARGRMRVPQIAPPASIGRLRLIGARGSRADVDVTQYRWVDVNCDLPVRTFNAYSAMLSLPNREPIVAVEVLAGRLVALTTLSGDPALAGQLRREFDVAARRAQAHGQQGRYAVAARKFPRELSWADADASHRLVLDVTPTHDVAQAVVRVSLDLRALAVQVAADPIAAPCRVRCFEDGQEAPAQFDEFRAGRGTLIIVPHRALRANETRRFVLYFGSAASAAKGPRVAVDASTAILDSGPRGVRCVFDLRGKGAGPRLMDVRFDLNGDGRFDESNVLGPTGFSGGYGSLTAVYDPYFWFDFAKFQTQPARARVVHAGPASATVVVDGLELFGCPGTEEVKLGGRWEGKTFTVGRKGMARWFFRVYAGRPYVDQWVEWSMDAPNTHWTRELQVRYGLAKYDPSVRRQGSQPGTPAVAKEFCVVASHDEPGRSDARAVRTGDGHVIEVLLGKPQQAGRYASNPWRLSPVALGGDELVASLAPAAVGVYALEVRRRGRVVRRAPKPVKPALASTLDTPVVAPGSAPALPGTLNWDPSFEKTKQYWSLSRSAAWSNKAARTGRVGVRLEVNKDKGWSLALVSTARRVNREMALEPNAMYKLTFWARCTSEKGRLNANLYWGDGYDFPHVTVDLPGDGKWRRYEVELRTAAYPPASREVFSRPPRIFPSLRLWCLGFEQTVDVDDVCLAPAQ